MTPSELNLRVIRADTPLRLGSKVLFAIRPRMIPFQMHWLLQVVEYEPERRFADRLVDGPFRNWEHRHEFQPLENGATEVVDYLEFGGLHPLIRRFVGKNFVRRKLEEIFSHREQVLRKKLEIMGDE